MQAWACTILKMVSKIYDIIYEDISSRNNKFKWFESVFLHLLEPKLESQYWYDFSLKVEKFFKNQIRDDGQLLEKISLYWWRKLELIWKGWTQEQSSYSHIINFRPISSWFFSNLLEKIWEGIKLELCKKKLKRNTRGISLTFSNFSEFIQGVKQLLEDR